MPAPTPPTPIASVPATPDRNLGEDIFVPQMYTFLDYFAPFKAYLQLVVTYCSDAITYLAGVVTDAAASASAAAESATTASDAAATVVQSASTSATVAGSLTPAIGSVSFTLDQTGKAFSVGQWVSISLTSAPTSKWMLGSITAFTAGTGAITVDVSATHGSGSSTGWSVTVSAPTVAVEWGQTQEVTGTSQTCANRGSYLFVNTGAQTTATLPASPTSGDKVRVDNGTTRIDLIINPNGEKIMGVSGNMTYNRAGAVEFEFINTTYGWRLR